MKFQANYAIKGIVLNSTYEALLTSSGVPLYKIYPPQAQYLIRQILLIEWYEASGKYVFSIHKAKF